MGRRGAWKPITERLWSKIMPEPNSGCWLWVGSIDKNTGYGHLGKNEYSSALAHRASYECFRGPIPVGLVIDHKCRVKSCVNPDHLEPVTHYENNVRGGVYDAAAKEKKSRTHCRKGHLYEPSNLVPSKSGTRVCRICHRAIAIAFVSRRRVLIKENNYGA